jgi:hypothetical protein
MSRMKKPATGPVPKALVLAIKHHTKEIGKHRDALRDLISDAEEIADTSDSAIQDLEHAVDTLSQYL